MKHELITEFEWDRKSLKLDQYVRKILNDKEFLFDLYEDKYIADKLVRIQNDKSKWDNDYFLEQITLLNANFSKVRLLHCLELREYIDGVKFKKSNNKLYILFGIVLVGCIALGYYALLHKQQDLQLKDTNVTNSTKK